MSRAGQQMVYRSKHCPTCGRVGRFHTFCSNKCKQKAYRERKQKVMLGSIAGISEMLIETIGESEAMSAFDHLNQISGKKNLEQSAAAIAVIVYAVNSILVRERKTKRGA